MQLPIIETNRKEEIKKIAALTTQYIRTRGTAYVRVNLHTRSYITSSYISSSTAVRRKCYSFSIVHLCAQYYPFHPRYLPSIERLVDSRSFLRRSNKPNDTLDTEYR